MTKIRFIKHSEFIGHDINTLNGTGSLYIDTYTMQGPVPRMGELVSITNYVNKEDYLIGEVIRIIYTHDGVVVVVHEEEID